MEGSKIVIAFEKSNNFIADRNAHPFRLSKLKNNEKYVFVLAVNSFTFSGKIVSQPSTVELSVTVGRVSPPNLNML